MNSSEHNTRVEKALKHCQSLINYYERRRTLARRNYMVFQTSAIILSGITPVLILGTEIPKIYQALPAALASIAAGLVVAFHFQENWIVCVSTSESLKSELVAFETRTSEWYKNSLDEDQVLENFLLRVENLHKSEISARAAMIKQSMASGDSK